MPALATGSWKPSATTRRASWPRPTGRDFATYIWRFMRAWRKRRSRPGCTAALWPNICVFGMRWLMCARRWTWPSATSTPRSICLATSERCGGCSLRRRAFVGFLAPYRVRQSNLHNGTFAPCGACRRWLAKAVIRRSHFSPLSNSASWLARQGMSLWSPPGTSALLLHPSVYIETSTPRASTWKKPWLNLRSSATCRISRWPWRRWAVLSFSGATSMRRVLGSSKRSTWLSTHRTTMARLEVLYGDNEAARRRFIAALDLVQESDALSVAQQVEGIAVTGLAADPRRAVMLFGAASRLREEVDTPIQLPWSIWLEPALAKARAVLPERIAEKAWESGRAMSPAQLFALAREAQSGARSGKTAISAGGVSKRELEVARLVASGMTSRAIAERLFLSERTVESHLEHILTKLGFSSRAQVAVWVAEHPGGANGDA